MLLWQRQPTSQYVCMPCVRNLICTQQMKLFPMSNCNKEKSLAPRGQFRFQERREKDTMSDKFKRKKITTNESLALWKCFTSL